MPQRDDHTDIRALHDIRIRLEAAENGGDADYIAGIMADDAVIMVPGEPVQEGRAACAAFVRNMLAYLLGHFHRPITYVSAEVRVIGHWAFDRGSFSFTVEPKSGGEPSEAHGKYLWLYSKSGSWKLARAIVSLDEDDAIETKNSELRTQNVEF